MIRACPFCGAQAVALRPVTDGFRYACDLEAGGCGAEAQPGATEQAAALFWNMGLVTAEDGPKTGEAA